MTSPSITRGFQRPAQPADQLPESPPTFLGTWHWRQPGPSETRSEWLDRTARQRATLVAATTAWLRVGQAVTIHCDLAAGGRDVAGKTGTVSRVCCPVFDDYVYVKFAATGRQKVDRIRMLPLESVIPTE